MTKPLDPRHVEVLDEVMVDVLRRKLPEERLRIGFNMWISAHNMLMTHIRHSHPDWDPRAVEREVARKMSHAAI
jgi:hypothetical protein